MLCTVRRIADSAFLTLRTGTCGPLAKQSATGQKHKRILAMLATRGSVKNSYQCHQGRSVAPAIRRPRDHATALSWKVPRARLLAGANLQQLVISRHLEVFVKTSTGKSFPEWSIVHCTIDDNRDINGNDRKCHSWRLPRGTVPYTLSEVYYALYLSATGRQPVSVSRTLIIYCNAFPIHKDTIGRLNCNAIFYRQKKSS